MYREFWQNKQFVVKGPLDSLLQENIILWCHRHLGVDPEQAGVLLVPQVLLVDISPALVGFLTKWWDSC